MGDLIAAHCDLDALLALARGAPAVSAQPWSPHPYRLHTPRPVVAIAGGAAFTFGYTEQAELLAAAAPG